jgi:hypothetical protein
MTKKKDAVLENEAAGDAAENRSDAPDQVEGEIAAPAPQAVADAAPTETPVKSGREWRGSHWANVGPPPPSIEMHEVSSVGELKNAGDYVMETRDADDPRRATLGEKYPIIACPGCLMPCGTALHTLVSEKPLTITASFLHRNADGSECWHGWVTDGKMTGR